MNYKVKLANWVRGFVNQLPSKARAQVFRRVVIDLSANPDVYLGPNVVPFADKYTLNVAVQDPSQHPFQWWLVFVVSRAVPGELHVESVRFAENPETN